MGTSNASHSTPLINGLGNGHRLMLLLACITLCGLGYTGVATSAVSSTPTSTGATDQLNTAAQILMSAALQATGKQFQMTVAASAEHPVTVKFSSPPADAPVWPVNFPQQGQQPIVRGVFSANVEMGFADTADNALAQSLAQSTGVAVQIPNPTLQITSGAIEFAGTVEFAAIKVHCSSGSISTQGKPGKTTYAEGTTCLLNDKAYVRSNGKWSIQ